MVGITRSKVFFFEHTWEMGDAGMPQRPASWVKTMRILGFQFWEKPIFNQRSNSVPIYTRSWSCGMSSCVRAFLWSSASLCQSYRRSDVNICQPTNLSTCLNMFQPLVKCLISEGASGESRTWDDLTMTITMAASRAASRCRFWRIPCCPWSLRLAKWNRGGLVDMVTKRH